MTIAALGVSFSSGFLGLAALMSLCTSPSVFLITTVHYYSAYFSLVYHPEYFASLIY